MTRRVLVLAGIGAGLVLRWWVLGSALGSVDYDEAVVGLMARSIGNGHPTMFFWGQAYGGSQEPAVVAFLFGIFGPQRLALKAVPIAFQALACWLTWRIGTRLFGPWAAATGGLLLWCFPAAFVWWSTKERGFYGLALVLGLAAVLLCMRIDERRRNPRSSDLIWLGVVAGIGLWVSPQVAYLGVPAVAWLVARNRRLIRQALPTLVAAVGSASPWLVWNAFHGWVSMHGPHLPKNSPGYFSRFGDFVTRLPVAFGLEEPFSGRRLMAGPTAIAVILVLGVVAFGAYVAGRRSDIVAWLAVGFGPLYATNSLVSYAGTHPRYLYLFTPVVAFALAGIVEALTQVSRPGPAVAVTAIAVVVSIWGLVVMDSASRDAVGNSDLADGDLPALAHTLDRFAINRVITDRVGPQLMFDTDERIIGSTFTDERNPAYAREIQRADRVAYVLQTDLEWVPKIETRLAEAGIPFVVQPVDRWTIVIPARNPCAPEGAVTSPPARLGCV